MKPNSEMSERNLFVMVQIFWPNGDWLLVRASNTEPILRAIAETRSFSASQALCKKALGV